METVEVHGATNTIGRSLITVCWAMTAITAPIICLRMYTRARISRKKLLADDYLMMLAMLIAMIDNATLMVSVHYGLGFPVSDVTRGQLYEAMKWFWIHNTTTVFVALFGRIAFTIYLMTILGPIHRGKRNILIFTIVIQIIANMGLLTEEWFTCGLNFRALWDPLVQAQSRCLNINARLAFAYVQIGCNCISDLALSIIPGLMIQGLKLKRGVKIGLMALLCLSGLAFVASALKAIPVATLTTYDVLISRLGMYALYGVVENNVILACASASDLRPLLRKWTAAVATGQSKASNRSDSGTKDTNPAAFYVKTTLQPVKVPRSDSAVSEGFIFTKNSAFRLHSSPVDSTDDEAESP